MVSRRSREVPSASDGPPCASDACLDHHGIQAKKVTPGHMTRAAPRGDGTRAWARRPRPGLPVQRCPDARCGGTRDAEEDGCIGSGCGEDAPGLRDVGNAPASDAVLECTPEGFQSIVSRHGVCPRPPFCGSVVACDECHVPAGRPPIGWRPVFPEVPLEGEPGSGDGGDGRRLVLRCAAGGAVTAWATTPHMAMRTAACEIVASHRDSAVQAPGLRRRESQPTAPMPPSISA